MAAIETIVRDAAQINFGPPPEATKTVTQNPQPFTINGGSPKSITLTESQSNSVNKSGDKEIERIVDHVRIKNPEDEEQYVDVAQPRKVKFNSGDGSKITVRYNDYVPSETTELLKTGVREVAQFLSSN